MGPLDGTAAVDTLPDSLLLEIFALAFGHDLRARARAASVCKRWHRLSFHNLKRFVIDATEPYLRRDDPGGRPPRRPRTPAHVSAVASRCHSVESLTIHFGDIAGAMPLVRAFLSYVACPESVRSLSLQWDGTYYVPSFEGALARPYPTRIGSSIVEATRERGVASVDERTRASLAASANRLKAEKGIMDGREVAWLGAITEIAFLLPCLSSLSVTGAYLTRDGESNGGSPARTSASTSTSAPPSSPSAYRFGSAPSCFLEVIAALHPTIEELDVANMDCDLLGRVLDGVLWPDEDANGTVVHEGRDGAPRPNLKHLRSLRLCGPPFLGTSAGPFPSDTLRRMGDRLKSLTWLRLENIEGDSHAASSPMKGGSGPSTSPLSSLFTGCRRLKYVRVCNVRSFDFLQAIAETAPQYLKSLTVARAGTLPAAAAFDAALSAAVDKVQSLESLDVGYPGVGRATIAAIARHRNMQTVRLSWRTYPLLAAMMADPGSNSGPPQTIDLSVLGTSKSLRSVALELHHWECQLHGSSEGCVVGKGAAAVQKRGSITAASDSVDVKGVDALLSSTAHCAYPNACFGAQLFAPGAGGKFPFVTEVTFASYGTKVEAPQRYNPRRKLTDVTPPILFPALQPVNLQRRMSMPDTQPRTAPLLPADARERSLAKSPSAPRATVGDARNPNKPFLLTAEDGAALRRLGSDQRRKSNDASEGGDAANAVASRTAADGANGGAKMNVPDVVVDAHTSPVPSRPPSAHTPAGRSASGDPSPNASRSAERQRPAVRKANSMDSASPRRSEYVPSERKISEERETAPQLEVDEQSGSTPQRRTSNGDRRVAVVDAPTPEALAVAQAQGAGTSPGKRKSTDAGPSAAAPVPVDAAAGTSATPVATPTKKSKRRSSLSRFTSLFRRRRTQSESDTKLTKARAEELQKAHAGAPPAPSQVQNGPTANSAQPVPRTPEKGATEPLSAPASIAASRTAEISKIVEESELELPPPLPVASAVPDTVTPMPAPLRKRSSDRLLWTDPTSTLRRGSKELVPGSLKRSEQNDDVGAFNEHLGAALEAMTKACPNLKTLRLVKCEGVPGNILGSVSACGSIESVSFSHVGMREPLSLKSLYGARDLRTVDLQIECSDRPSAVVFGEVVQLMAHGVGVHVAGGLGML